MNNYNDAQVDILLNLYFRNKPRPLPYPSIARAMGLTRYDGLDDLLWKVITGHSGKDATGPRRVYVPGSGRISMQGCPWRPRDDRALRAAMTGKGQLRNPACDTAYIAAVLGRPEPEVEARWATISGDALDRDGFGL